jgi:hypothetical protein
MVRLGFIILIYTYIPQIVRRRTVSSSSLCKKLEGAVAPILVEALEDGMDDAVDALDVGKDDHTLVCTARSRCMFRPGILIRPCLKRGPGAERASSPACARLRWQRPGMKRPDSSMV